MLIIIITTIVSGSSTLQGYDDFCSFITRSMIYWTYGGDYWIYSILINQCNAAQLVSYHPSALLDLL